jgi:F0F1-type ATP synthase assembly protein I
MLIKFKLNKKSLKALKHSSYGLYSLVPIFLGLTIGLLLDSIFNTRPILVLVFLFLGVLSSFYNLFVLVKEFQKNNHKQNG